VSGVSSCARRADVRPPSTPASTAALIPFPAAVEWRRDSWLTIAPTTVIHVPPGNEDLLRIGRQLADVIGIVASPHPPTVDSTGSAPGAGAIVLRLGDVAAAGDDAYDLDVTSQTASITGRTAAGVFYGVQTFRQLLPYYVEHDAAREQQGRVVRAPAARIVDAPRFRWRGAMLDVARHFLTVAEVKRYIDLMALYKLNLLHLHLSDDQGWRIEIKSWPNLTKVGGSTEVGGGPGGFYTQAEYSAIVGYAASRFITVVPEIDMPGHTNAALASYAELNCDGVARPAYTGIEVGFSAFCVDKDVTYRFIDDVVREIVGLTPGGYFHIGGDEVKTLTPAHYQQFIERVAKIVRSHKAVVVGWDEIASAALDAGTLIQHWRPEGAILNAAVARGAKVIMSVASRAYLDMKYHADTPIGLNWAGYVDVKTAYDWDPGTIAEGVREDAILGVEAPLWAETIANIDDVEFLAFPRLAAIAEVAWSRQQDRDWDRFKVRLGQHGPRLAALGVNFYRSPAIPWRQ
jgi:hexosaminidase